MGKRLCLVLSLLCLMLSTMGAQCEPEAKKHDPFPALDKVCRLNPEQFGSFLTPPVAAFPNEDFNDYRYMHYYSSNFPLRVIVDNSFSSREIEQIQIAFDEWNNFGRYLIGKDFFASVVSMVPKVAREAVVGQCGPEVGSVDEIYVVRETDLDHWKKLSLKPGAEGVRFRCETSAEFGPQMLFFLDSKIDVRQLAGIALHELGHALGLHHSCDYGLGPDLDDQYTYWDKFIACKDTKNPLYLDAAMYPSFRDAKPTDAFVENRKQLRTNDMERIKCLYLDQVKL